MLLAFFLPASSATFRLLIFEPFLTTKGSLLSGYAKVIELLFP
tara:strand:+ start:686 stop:814 length:129 start_codon:yes stop_codon:yes gene_type:complete